MLRIRTSMALAMVLLSTTVAVAAIDGRVVSADGEPVENAQVEMDGGLVAYTDLDGRFSLAGIEPPAALVVTHPLFDARYIEVEEASPADIELVARPIRQVIAVSANRGDSSYAPSSVAATVVTPADLAAPPATLSELVVTAPGVSENGQGGIFQTYSIRGTARLRVLTLLSGMRVIGERRAGVSASFVDPGLMGNVDILRGPSSTFYGSGALGGVIQMFPRRFRAPVAEFGFDSNGDGVQALAGWGDDRWSFGIAHRRSDEGETPDGQVLNDDFEQTSATAHRQWQSGPRRYSLLAIASHGADIGKSNSDFPDRVTVYPEENHLMLRFAVRGETGWRLEAWTHPNDLRTEVLRDGDLTTTDNESLDLGFNWQQRRKWGERDSIRYGFEYFGRQGVSAMETIEPVDGRPDPVLAQQSLDGDENELGLYGAYERHFGGTVLLLGGRVAAIEQTSGTGASRDDTALTGFAGLVVPLREGVELTANLGSGLRFPSLSERYFSGVTPRGFVAGNADLEPERSRTLDAGLRFHGSRYFLSVGAFVNSIEDYIERIELVDDELTFVNLTSGELEGLEFESGFSTAGGVSYSFGGHSIEGRGDGGEPLADVPPDRLFLGAGHKLDRWRWRARWEHRFGKSDPGSGESVLAAADLVSASLGYSLGNGVRLALAGRNLLDETYFNSADDRASISRGRSVTLTVGWTGS